MVAVSGGLDSMVLLHVLRDLAGRNSWRLTVAHLNHGLRGRNSDADERLVIRTAKKLGLPVVTERANVKKIAQARGISIEMAAREVRHGFLARAAAQLKIKTIALAHHADDQVELFFLRVFRGSGGEGLSGMKWRGPSPANPDIELIRPLLDQPKTAVRAFAASCKIPFREDTSNASLDFRRNRIRHELLPLLKKKYQPSLERAILRLMDIAGAEADCVGRLAGEWVERKTRTPFSRLSLAVQRRCIQWQLLRRKLAADFDRVEFLRTHPGSPVSITLGNSIVLDANGRLRAVEIERERAGPNSEAVEVDLRCNAGEIVFANLKISWRIRPHKPSGRAPARPGREWFDADKIGPGIILRQWRPGDRFQPSGMESAVKLQDLFTNRKIPRNERHLLAMAATADGELFWVQKLRIAERFKLSDDTNRRLEWRWKHL